MSNRKISKPKNFGKKSRARRLKERLVKEKGKTFKHQDFHAIDPGNQVLEKAFHETGETVQVHLSRNKKLHSVYLICTR